VEGISKNDMITVNKMTYDDGIHIAECQAVSDNYINITFVNITNQTITPNPGLYRIKAHLNEQAAQECPDEAAGKLWQIINKDGPTNQWTFDGPYKFPITVRAGGVGLAVSYDTPSDLVPQVDPVTRSGSSTYNNVDNGLVFGHNMSLNSGGFLNLDGTTDFSIELWGDNFQESVAGGTTSYGVPAIALWNYAQPSLQEWKIGSGEPGGSTGFLFATRGQNGVGVAKAMLTSSTTNEPRQYVISYDANTQIATIYSNGNQQSTLDLSSNVRWRTFLSIREGLNTPPHLVLNEDPVRGIYNNQACYYELAFFDKPLNATQVANHWAGRQK